MIDIRVEQELDHKIVEDVIENTFLNAKFIDHQEHSLVTNLERVESLYQIIRIKV